VCAAQSVASRELYDRHDGVNAAGAVFFVGTMYSSGVSLQLTDVGSWKEESSKGRLCLLFWLGHDASCIASQPRRAEFLREFFPKDSVFVAQACSWSGVHDSYVDWSAAVVSPHDVEIREWLNIWQSVSRQIQVGNVRWWHRVKLIKPGGELEAQQEYAALLDVVPGRVRTGSVSEVERALCVCVDESD
jgi:hypothetical protein